MYLKYTKQLANLPRVDRGQFIQAKAVPQNKNKTYSHQDPYGYRAQKTSRGQDKDDEVKINEQGKINNKKVFTFINK